MFVRQKHKYLPHLILTSELILATGVRGACCSKGGEGFSLVIPEKLATDVQLQLGKQQSDKAEWRLNFLRSVRSVTKVFALAFSQASPTMFYRTRDPPF